MKRAVFLDRDGVLNRALLRGGERVPPSRLEDVEILPGVPEALVALRAAGFVLPVVTNQPDVARGSVARSFVEGVNALLAGALLLDGFYVCYHDDRDACECRKPKAGLLLAAARDLEIDLEASFMVGDRWRDVGAGAAAGCTTLLVASGEHDEGVECRPDITVTSLLEAAQFITGRTRA